MKGINKSFGQNQVLRDAGFVLDDGEVHALMGENGAGKSTTLKAVAGLVRPKSGEILLDASIAGDYGKPVILVAGDGLCLRRG